MSFELTLLTAFMAGLALLSLIRPAKLFEYPVAASLLMMAFILPQAWQIEATGQGVDYDPPGAWRYMILCMLALLGGFVLTTRVGKGQSVTPKGGFDDFSKHYDIDKLYKACVALAVVGGA